MYISENFCRIQRTKTSNPCKLIAKKNNRRAYAYYDEKQGRSIYAYCVRNIVVDYTRYEETARDFVKWGR